MFLGALKTNSGSGKDKFDAVYEAVTEWGHLDIMQATCCNTTASNTGKYNSACILLQKAIKRELLYSARRHGVAEFKLKAAIKVKFGKISSPVVPFFKKFQDVWTTSDVSMFKSGIEDQIVRDALKQ